MRHLITAASLLLISSIVAAQTGKTAADKYQKEVNELLKNKPIQEAMTYIGSQADESTRDLIRLTEIPAPPFKESVRAEAFKKMLIASGAKEVRMDSAGNVLYLRKGKPGGSIIVLDAHLDTVFPEGTDVTVKRRGDTLFAPGILDDTRGLVVALSVLRALEQANIITRHDILFVGSVGEEGPGDLRGVRYLLKHIKPVSWISLDDGDTGFGNITNGALGSLRYRVTVKGPGGHSWGAFGTGNTHHAMARAIDVFTREATEFTSSPGPRTSFNVGVMGGGTSVNSIPYESWMEVDMRAEDPGRLDGIDHIFQSSIRKGIQDYNMTLKQGPKLTVEFRRIGYRPSGATALDASIVQRAKTVITHFGEQPTFDINSTNSNIPISLGIPAVTIGTGGKGGDVHSLKEWWMPDANAVEAAKAAMVLVLLEAGVVGK